MYKFGIDTGIASFETEVPDWAHWDQKYLDTCRLVAVYSGILVGFAVLSPYSKRAVYKGVAEVSVYIDPTFWNRGIGRSLLEKLITESESAGVWTLQANIFPQNENSLKLHQKCGFREVGIRERIGKRDGKWFDNVLLERRSKNTGIA